MPTAIAIGRERNLAAIAELIARNKPRWPTSWTRTGQRCDPSRSRCEPSWANASARPRALDEQIAELEAELREAIEELEQYRQRLRELASKREALAAELERDQQAEAELKLMVEQHRTALAAAERRLDRSAPRFGTGRRQHRRLDAQLTRVRERIAVLSELESRLEGLGWRRARNPASRARGRRRSHLGDVRGVVADLFHVDVDSAPLVEVALGERAQYVVVTSTSPLLEWLHGQPLKVAEPRRLFGAGQPPPARRHSIMSIFRRSRA